MLNEVHKCQTLNTLKPFIEFNTYINQKFYKSMNYHARNGIISPMKPSVTPRNGILSIPVFPFLLPLSDPTLGQG